MGLGNKPKMSFGQGNMSIGQKKPMGLNNMGKKPMQTSESLDKKPDAAEPKEPKIPKVPKVKKEPVCQSAEKKHIDYF